MTGMDAAPGDAARSASGRLTAREREVLGLVASGLSSREIAATLGVHPTTVDAHVRASCDKLRAQTRLQAALALLSSGAERTGARRPPALDPETRRVMQLLADGRTRQEIARAVGLSVRTVARRIAAARGALEVGTTAEAVGLVHGASPLLLAPIDDATGAQRA